jgi:hypothetical protein
MSLRDFPLPLNWKSSSFGLRMFQDSVSRLV